MVASCQELKHHASGWWATIDAGNFNTDVQVPERQVGTNFASQFAVTGQSGIGTSLFNIGQSCAHHENCTAGSKER